MSHLRRLSFWHWFSLVFAIGAGLRVWGLADARMWYDELNSGWWAALPFERMVQATAGDVHPPAYYALLWLLNLVTPLTPATMRLPSALFSMGALPLTAVIGRKLKLGDAGTLIATGIMAFAPFQLSFAQEARMYALFQTAILGAVASALHKRWWLMGASVAAMLWTHNYSFLYTPLIVGLAALVGWSQGVKNFPRAIGLPIATAGASYAPWAFTLAQQMGTAKSNWWQLPTTPGMALSPLYTLIFGENPGIGIDLIWRVVAFGLAGLVAIKLLERREWGPLLLSALVVTPPIMAWGAELVYRPIFLNRAFIGSSAPLYLLIGWALTNIKSPFRRAFGLNVAFSAIGMAAVLFYPVRVVFRGMYLAPPPALVSQLQPGDLIYHINAGTLTDWHYDLPPDTWQVMAPNFAGDKGNLTPATIAAMGVTQARLQDVPGWRRAWVAFTAGPNVSGESDQYIETLLREYPSDVIAIWGDTPIYGDLMRGEVHLVYRETAAQK